MNRTSSLLRTSVLVALVAAFLTIPGCLSSSTMTPPGSVTNVPSGNLNPFVYFEEGTALFVAVDTRAAQYIKKEGLFPLGLALANNAKSSLTFNRESFILETEDGTQYPMVSPREFNESYHRSRTDARLSQEFRSILNQRLNQTYRFVEWPLYSYSGQNRNPRESLELGRLFWTQSMMYFPVPESGLHGKNFALLVSANEITDAFVVRFQVR